MNKSIDRRPQRFPLSTIDDRLWTRRTPRGQAIAEYAIVFSLILGALLAMQTYAKRGIQGVIKNAADQVGDQLNGIRFDSGDRPSPSALEEAGVDPSTLDGQTLIRESAGSTVADKDVHLETQLGGTRITNTLQDTTTTTGSLPLPAPGSVHEGHLHGPGASFYSETITQTYPYQ